MGEKSWPKHFLSHQLPHKERNKTFLSTFLLQLLLDWSTEQTEQGKGGGEQRQRNERRIMLRESGKEITDDVEICTILLTLL